MIKTVEKELEIVYLYPAAMEVPQTPKRVHTILGSCIAVCLFDKVKKTGGINHYMLPYWNGTGLATPKYGNIAIEKLVSHMVAKGSKQEHLIAKIFGGAAVLDATLPSFNIGQRNIEVAKELIEKYKIPLVAQSTGGKNGRKIIFNTSTGEIVHRFIKSEET